MTIICDAQEVVPVTKVTFLILFILCSQCIVKLGGCCFRTRAPDKGLKMQTFRVKSLCVSAVIADCFQLGT